MAPTISPEPDRRSKVAVEAADRPPRGRWWRLALFVAVVLGIQAAGSWLAGLLELEIWPRHSPMLDLAGVLISAAYVITMALPFVPGIEIGLAVMLVFGAQAIPAIYACTQLALALSFLVGRLVPLGVLAAGAGWLHLHALRRLLARLEPLAPTERLALLTEKAPRAWVRRLITHRYLALAVLINLPGNAILGGAGGIGLVAGMSRVFSLPRYLLLMAVATSPVPLVLWFGGTG